MRQWGDALAWALALWLLALWLPAWADAPPAPCAPLAQAVSAARAAHDAPLDAPPRPADGWEAVTLPDDWTRRWPAHDGTVWYRIEWTPTACAEPLALGIDALVMAGEVYLNDDLLWRDAALVEPLSRSWNMPRWWLLPQSALRDGANTVWVRVIGTTQQTPGLGTLRLGAAPWVAAEQAGRQWRQRTMVLITAALSAAVGGLFLIVWCLLREERAFGWYALMSLWWVLYLATMLATDPWPFADTLALSRANIALFVLYVLCFCRFTWAFGAQALPRAARALWGLGALGVLAALLAPRALLAETLLAVWLGFVLLFFANCVQFQWHAWRTRDPQHMLLALLWLIFLVIGGHDLLVILRLVPDTATWSWVSAPLATVCMALLLGGRLAAGMRRIGRFNQELEASVADARAELAQALAREHAQALEHAKLQERVEIAHDLHDGLGGSLVRSMALVEQAPQPLPTERVLSLLKVLRDDLRQVIDHGSSAGATVPATPVQWAAPLRHRFTRIFDELDVASEWHIDPQWHDDGARPSALQCLGLARVVEEALSNVIKHSRARRVRVECTQPQADTLVVRIGDDGVGFDVHAVRHAGLSVGMRSMAARTERLGGTLEVVSGPQGTVVSAVLAVAPG